MTPTAEQWERADAINAGMQDDETILDSDSGYEQWACLACALLTSANKAEREQGKTLVRSWRRAGISHAKQLGVES